MSLVISQGGGVAGECAVLEPRLIQGKKWLKIGW